MKTDRDAKKGLILSTILTIPVWFYFAFIGTSLYVYYKLYPSSALDQLVSEQAFPYFVLTQVPAGVAGFVISGLLAAAMSTLDSGINASAATVTNDFYRRFNKVKKDEQHYLKFGRWISLVFGLIMIFVALFINFTLHLGDTIIIKKLIFFAILFIFIFSLYLINKPISDIPALGKFFNPYSGYLALVNSDHLPSQDISLQYLNDDVKVVWDDRRIPHIFANNNLFRENPMMFQKLDRQNSFIFAKMLKLDSIFLDLLK